MNLCKQPCHLQQRCCRKRQGGRCLQVRKYAVNFKVACLGKDCFLVDDADVAVFVGVFVRNVIRQIICRDDVDSKFVGFFDNGNKVAQTAEKHQLFHRTTSFINATILEKSASCII